MAYRRLDEWAGPATWNASGHSRHDLHDGGIAPFLDEPKASLTPDWRTAMPSMWPKGRITADRTLPDARTVG